MIANQIRLDSAGEDIVIEIVGKGFGRENCEALITTCRPT